MVWSWAGAGANTGGEDAAAADAADAAVVAGGLSDAAAGLCRAASVFLRAAHVDDDSFYVRFLPAANNFTKQMMREQTFDESADFLMDLYRSCWKKYCNQPRAREVQGERSC